MSSFIKRIEKFSCFLKNNQCKTIKLNCFSTKSSEGRPVRILGIETSCDDTGIAIVDGNGKILGEALNSQQNIHIKHGGIIPNVAKELHQDNIEYVYKEALLSAQMTVDDVDAIATTIKPGLPLSLVVGVKFGKELSKMANKPFIPIHHMEAHALTARMTEKIDFPFLTLLMSGGNCLLAVAVNESKFYRLGSTTDDAPGEAFDKVARRLKIHNIPEYQNMSSGQAIELAARKATNPEQFTFPVILPQSRCCNFSFSGLKSFAKRLIDEQEEKFQVAENEVISNFEDLCAAFQCTIARHLAVRLKRAMIFCDRKNLIPFENSTLVVSGGVASNQFIRKVLERICHEMSYRLVRPPPRLCTDNGIMIAWNGVEKWHANVEILRDPLEIEQIEIQNKSPLGEDWTEKVKFEQIQCSHLRVKEIFG